MLALGLEFWLALGLALGFEFWLAFGLALGLEFWPENSLNLFWLAFTIVFTWFDDGIQI